MDMHRCKCLELSKKFCHTEKKTILLTFFSAGLIVAKRDKILLLLLKSRDLTFTMRRKQVCWARGCHFCTVTFQNRRTEQKALLLKIISTSQCFTCCKTGVAGHWGLVMLSPHQTVYNVYSVVTVLPSEISPAFTSGNGVSLGCCGCSTIYCHWEHLRGLKLLQLVEVLAAPVHLGQS